MIWRSKSSSATKPVQSQPELSRPCLTPRPRPPKKTTMEKMFPITIYQILERESTRSALGTYRGCLHQVLIVIPVISKHIFSEPCRMACAIIWLRPSKQESATCERRNKWKQHALPTLHRRTWAKMSSVGHSPSQGTSGDSGRWVWLSQLGVENSDT